MNVCGGGWGERERERERDREKGGEDKRGRGSKSVFIKSLCIILKNFTFIFTFYLSF
jgi:hypothetical protein